MWGTKLNKNQLFFKIFTVFIVIFILFLILYISISFKIIDNFIIRIYKSNLNKIEKAIEPAILEKLNTLYKGNSDFYIKVTSKKYMYIKVDNFNEYIQDIENTVKKLGKRLDLRITVISPNGKILADSDKNPILMENHLKRPEIIDAIKNIKGYSLRFSTTVRHKLLYFAVKLPEQVPGFLRISLYIENVEILFDSLRKKLFIVLLFMSIATFIILLLFTKKYLSPLKTIVEITGKVAEGNFNHQIIVKSKDEIGELVENFNIMIKKINTLVKDLKNEKKLLSNILNNIEEGLIIIDKNKKIVLANKYIKEILSFEITTEYIWEVLKDSKFNNFLDNVIKNRGKIGFEIILNKRYFYVTSVYIKSLNFISIFFYDITEIKKVENIKKSFISNVSHELKTPLTSIKGFIEEVKSLEKGNGGNTEKMQYLNIIEKNTNRMINIIKDLLIISELESETIKPEIKSVNIVDEINNIIQLYKRKAANKGLKLNTNFYKDNIIIKADPYKFEQLIVNLLDNAIKYTDKGFIDINVYENKDNDTNKDNNKDNNIIRNNSINVGNNIIVEIKDTGIGIEEKEIDRIFERFYVVDKSRSKKTGGTGLGLSIVKHIVTMHGWKIKVESEFKKGTSFKIEIL